MICQTVVDHRSQFGALLYFSTAICFLVLGGIVVRTQRCCLSINAHSIPVIQIIEIFGEMVHFQLRTNTSGLN